MNQEEYLLKLDEINNRYKEEVQNLAVQYVKEHEEEFYKKGTVLEFLGAVWTVKHARVKAHNLDVPSVIYTCTNKSGRQRDFYHHQIGELIEAWKQKRAEE